MAFRKGSAGAEPERNEIVTSDDSSARKSTAFSEASDAQPLVFYPPRRRMLELGVGVGVGLSVSAANAAKPPRSQRPQPGDLIVFRFGDKVGEAVKPSDVPGGAEMLQVISKDPATGQVRDGSRLNGVNLVQVDQSKADDETKGFVVGGVIGYSSVCTHQGCDLTQWIPDTTTFKCYCHYSEFDATKYGAPNHGPATRRLAVLPMALNEQGELTVAAKFDGRVGFK